MFIKQFTCTTTLNKIRSSNRVKIYLFSVSSQFSVIQFCVVFSSSVVSAVPEMIIIYSLPYHLVGIIVVNVNFPTFSYHRDILYPYKDYVSPYMGMSHFLTQNPTLFSALSNFFTHIAQRQKIATKKDLLQR